MNDDADVYKVLFCFQSWRVLPKLHYNRDPNVAMPMPWAGPFMPFAVLVCLAH